MVFGIQLDSLYAPAGLPRRNSCDVVQLLVVQLVVLVLGTAAVTDGFTSSASADDACWPAVDQPSWIFARSTYTNDPRTGARVAQFERTPPVEDLDDVRNITSSYRRTQTVLRGPDGSSDVYYQVQAWGNGLGGIDAEWERFHEAWKESILSSGSYYFSPPGGYGPGPGYFGGGYGYGYGPGYGQPGYGSPGYGYGRYGPYRQP